MASLELRTAWLRPRICAVMLSATERPEASSLARLIRLPEESRSMAVCCASWVVVRERCAFNDPILVLITCIFFHLFSVSPSWISYGSLLEFSVWRIAQWLEWQSILPLIFTASVFIIGIFCRNFISFCLH